MKVSLHVRVKGGLPLKAECSYIPGQKQTYWDPGFAPELNVEELHFKSGHKFNMDSLSDEQLEELHENAYKEFKNNGQD